MVKWEETVKRAGLPDRFNTDGPARETAVRLNEVVAREKPPATDFLWLGAFCCPSG